MSKTEPHLPDWQGQAGIPQIKTEDVIKLYQQYVMPTYTRTQTVLARGKGIKAYDIEGREFLDFFPGWAVSGIGHCHPKVVSAIRKQAKKMLHISNNYYNELQARLAKKIVEHSFDGKVFFCNSGAEAVEGAMKLARRFGNPSRYEIITMENSFHGRTLATITATAQTKYQEGFAPLPTGFVYAPFNDLDAVKAKITEKTVAIMLEPIQGEGGINVAEPEFLAGLRQLCDERNLLLIFDEIQTGMGRTGKMFCYQHYDVVPDIMTLSKTLGGGFPIGAFIASRQRRPCCYTSDPPQAGREIAAGVPLGDTLQPGMHASTFGGGPLACAASLATFEAIEQGNLVAKAEKRGRYLHKKLLQLKNDFPFIKQVRGKGLMQGMEIETENLPADLPAEASAKAGDKIVQKCLEQGLLINCTQKKVLRLMPPLIVKNREIDTAISILENALRTVATKPMTRV